MSLIVLSYSIQRSFSLSSFLFIWLLPIWVVSTLAETHRAPFDFSEAESELVSGFNTEYSGAFFAFIFLSEYGVLLYSCMLISYLFFGMFIPVFFSSLILLSLSLVWSFIFI
jgi:NADH:ubiquinone oxidoreductase subunit H